MDNTVNGETQLMDKHMLMDKPQLLDKPQLMGTNHI